MVQLLATLCIFAHICVSGAGDVCSSPNSPACGENRTTSGGNLFIQFRQGITRVREPGRPVVWVAQPFSDCFRPCTDSPDLKPSQVRTRGCFTIDGEEVSEELCAGLPRPALTRHCGCGVLGCDENVCKDLHPDTEDTTDNEDDEHFECLGCFPVAEEEYQPQFVENKEVSVLDETCIDHDGQNGPCRGGMPFFRMRSNAMTPVICFEFCIGEGLDLFALVQGVECRCGATALNLVWQGKKPRPGLQLPPTMQSSCLEEGECPMRVYRWKGPFVAGGSVQSHLLKISEGDQAHVTSVVLGQRIGHMDGTEPEHEVAEVAEAAKGDSLAQTDSDSDRADRIDPNWLRNCPECNAGRHWWERSNETPDGMIDQWVDVVVVRYNWAASCVDDEVRKEAFRAAAEVWRTETCIALIEDHTRVQGQQHIRVNKASGGCSATVGRAKPSEVYLGWCNSMGQRGNIVHETGFLLRNLNVIELAIMGV